MSNGRESNTACILYTIPTTRCRQRQRMSLQHQSKIDLNRHLGHPPTHCCKKIRCCDLHSFSSSSPSIPAIPQQTSACSLHFANRWANCDIGFRLHWSHFCLCRCAVSSFIHRSSCCRFLFSPLFVSLFPLTCSCLPKLFDIAPAICISPKHQALTVTSLQNWGHLYFQSDNIFPTPSRSGLLSVVCDALLIFASRVFSVFSFCELQLIISFCFCFLCSAAPVSLPHRVSLLWCMCVCDPNSAHVALQTTD